MVFDISNPFIYASKKLQFYYSLLYLYEREKEVLEGLISSNLSSWTCLLYSGGFCCSIILRQLNRNDIFLCSPLPPLAYYVVHAAKFNLDSTLQQHRKNIHTQIQDSTDMRTKIKNVVLVQYLKKQEKCSIIFPQCTKPERKQYLKVIVLQTRNIA